MGGGADQAGTGTDTWSAEELQALDRALAAEVVNLRIKLADTQEETAGLGRGAGSEGGQDPGDLGTALSEHEQGFALAEHVRDRLDQTERAIERIRAGSYGICEGCGTTIAKARLEAFPRATLCVSCKQRN